MLSIGMKINNETDEMDFTNAHLFSKKTNDFINEIIAKGGLEINFKHGEDSISRVVFMFERDENGIARIVNDKSESYEKPKEERQ